jgi:hypothetical protein
VIRTTMQSFKIARTLVVSGLLIAGLLGHAAVDASAATGSFALKEGRQLCQLVIKEVDGTSHLIPIPPDLSDPIKIREQFDNLPILGNKTFGPAVSYLTGPGPSAIVAVDLNGDGKADLAVSNLDSPLKGFDPGFISVLLNRGDGTFANKVDYQTAQHPTAIVAGDFNGDGRMDLAVAGNLDVVGVVSSVAGQRRRHVATCCGLHGGIRHCLLGDGRLQRRWQT